MISLLFWLGWLFDEGEYKNLFDDKTFHLTFQLNEEFSLSLL